MKQLLLLLLLTPFFGLAQDVTAYEQVPETQIDRQRLAFVTSLSDRILTAQQGGGFYQLSEQEADAAIRSGLSEAVQKQAYSQLSRSFGEYRGLVFDELLMPTEGTPYEIYRFRGKFGANGTGVEIRSVLNPEGKLAGFYYKPWKARL
jgi:hypothetical protein